MTDSQIVLITGGSRGFGEAAGQLIADRGHTVVCTMRHPERDAPEVIAGREDRMHPTQLDVLDAAAVNRVVDETVTRFGRIDVLINNAGYGLQGSTEDCTEEEVWRSLDTNFLGQRRMMRAVLPHMRARGQGKIVNVSSTAGRLSGGLGGFYASTKHAVEAMSEAARYELHGSGVQVCIIEPGMFRSDWQTTNLDVCEAFREGRALYQGVMERTLVAFRALAATRPGSASVAAAMADMVDLQDPLPLRWPVGNDATHQLGLRAKATDEEWDTYRGYVGYGPRGEELGALPQVDPDPAWSWREDNVVLVTGAAGAVGSVAVRELARRGNTVVAADLAPASGALPDVHPISLDVADPEAVDAAMKGAVERLGRIDAVVNAAGYGIFGSIEDCTDEEVARALQTNYLGQWRVGRAAMPWFREQRHGKIINVGALYASAPPPFFGVYAAAKLAVDALTEAVVTEGSHWGVQATLIQPGLFRSRWFEDNLVLCEALRSRASAYQAGAERLLAATRRDASARPAPDAVGAAIADAVELQQPLPVRWPIGHDVVALNGERRVTPDPQWEAARVANGQAVTAAERAEGGSG